MLPSFESLGLIAVLNWQILLWLVILTVAGTFKSIYLSELYLGDEIKANVCSFSHPLSLRHLAQLIYS